LKNILTDNFLKVFILESCNNIGYL